VNVPLVLFALYLFLGMATTASLWITMPDELELAISMDLEDEDDRPVLRMILTIVFVVAWPLILVDVVRRR
jgi:hypothetical protein